MVTTSAYFLQILGNPTIEISQDELRSLLGEIEAELHRSQVYRRALAAIQKTLGDSAEQAKMLLKAVGREAIGLAFRQFAQEYEKVETFTDTQQHIETPNVAPDAQQDNSHDLSQCLTSAKFHTSAPEINTKEKNSRYGFSRYAFGVSQSPVIENKTNNSVKTTQDKSTAKTPLAWLTNKNKKISKAELAKQTAVEQRLEKLREIGQQLRQVRESQNLSLYQLHVYTHVPVHQMEALENGDLESLPEDVFIRGFIRVMANALGMNGTVLAASLPSPEPVKSVLPSWYQPKNNSGGFGLEIRPIHLYVGYTALVAGAVGGLSLMSQQQQVDANKLINQDEVPSSSSISESFKQKEPIAKPGIKSSNAGFTVGPDIAPPEAL